MAEKGAGVLKYEVIYSWVVKNIFDGVFPYKSKLPSEAQLMAQFSVSRQTVRNAMKKLAETGYIQSVRGSGSYVSRQTYGSSKKIGVMFTTISGYICSDIFNGLESVLSKLGYSIQLELSHNSVDNETRFLKKMLKSNVAGIILEPTKSGFPTPNANLFHKLDEAGIPYVFVNSCYRNVKSNAVVWDDEKVSYHLTRHLIKSGHPNIGCFFRFDEMQGMLRYLGYANALRDCGLPINEHNICWYSIDDEDNFMLRNESCVEYTLNQCIENCSALICYNDIIAASIINKLRARSIAIPEEMTLVSFDNSDLVQFFGIEGFLSFDHPKARLGEAAARMLVDYIVNKKTEKSVLVVTSRSNG